MRRFVGLGCILFLSSMLLMHCGGEIAVSIPGCEQCPDRCLVSDEGRGKCVRCLNNSHCKEDDTPTRKCDENNKCICGSDQDCPTGLHCAGAKGCLTCIENKHCPAENPVCSNNSCVACKTGDSRACSPDGLEVCRKGTQTCRQNGSWDDCKGVVTCTGDKVCVNGECQDKACTSNECDSRQCGKDKCGKSCGTCKNNEVCSSTFQCVATCTEGQSCQLKDLKGPCATGKIVCKNNKPTCQQVVTSQKETCNKVDDDCDGVIDEGCPCNYLGKAQGVCATAKLDDKGQCTKPSGYSVDERCDAIDHNCDGSNSKSAVDVGKPCKLSSLKGPCATGTSVCTNDAIECKQTVQPSTETCNNVDDDCDGQIDNSSATAPLEQTCYTGQAGCTQQPDGTYQCIGTCKSGIRTCQQGSWSKACTGEVVPQTEACDNKDNNCNGVVDEGCSCNYLGKTKGVCVQAVRDAKGVCTKPATYSTKETCDKLDNDCNGKVDDNVSGGFCCSPSANTCGSQCSSPSACLQGYSSRKCAPPSVTAAFFTRCSKISFSGATWCFAVTGNGFQQSHTTQNGLMKWGSRRSGGFTGSNWNWLRTNMLVVTVGNYGSQYVGKTFWIRNPDGQSSNCIKITSR